MGTGNELYSDSVKQVPSLHLTRHFTYKGVGKESDYAIQTCLRCQFISPTINGDLLTTAVAETAV